MTEQVYTRSDSAEEITWPQDALRRLGLRFLCYVLLSLHTPDLLEPGLETSSR